MTLRHLTIFVSVFRRSSITKAADDLHLAQPSVSLAIRELEDYYGIRLFERIGRRIFPTEAGTRFYSYAVHITSLFSDMENTMKNWDAHGTIRIGSSITIGTCILPVLIRQFQNEHPDLQIESFVSNSADIMRRLSAGSIDLGLIEIQSDQPDIRCIPFMQDSLCAIVPPFHPLTQKPCVSLEELAEYPFLMREKGSAGRDILDACFSIHQVSVHPLWESSSTEALVHAVVEGLGVAILPNLLVERDIQDGIVSRIPLTPELEQELKRGLNIIYHKSKYLTPNMNAFIALCRQYGSQN